MEEVTALWKGEINEFEETIDHLKELAEELPDTFQKFDRTRQRAYRATFYSTRQYYQCYAATAVHKKK